ncbi:MAG TPA: hypothetical protein VM432_09610 [Bdellovibrionales bacterium]|nr:hypothetical protein [Bdellovibrionales bacterium]
MNLANSKGQMTIEMVLILTILLGAAVGVTRAMKSNQVLAAIVEGPWASMQGMIEDGVWVPAGKSKASHPTMRSRHRSFEGENVPDK